MSSVTLTRDGVLLPPPTLWREHSMTTESTNQVYLDPATGEPTVIYGPREPRRSLLALFYTDETDAWMAEAKHLEGGTFSIRHRGRPTHALDYVVTGQVTRTLDADTATTWIVTAEVTSLGTATVGVTTDLAVRRNLCCNSGHVGGLIGFVSNAGASGVTLTPEAYDTHDGQAALRVTSQGLGTSRGVNQTPAAYFPLASATVTASVWVKMLTPGVDLNLDLQRRSAANAYIDSKFVRVPTTGDWQRLSITRTDMVPGEKCSTPVTIPTAAAATFLVTEWLIEETSEVRPWFGVPPGTIREPVRAEGSIYASPTVLDRVRTLAPSAGAGDA